MSCSKSGRTTLGIIVLVSLKHGGATKLRESLITSFNLCVVIEKFCCKNSSTGSHIGNTKIHKFWGVMLCRCVIHSRIYEDTRFFRTTGIHSSNKTKSLWLCFVRWMTRIIRMMFAFTLYFTGHNFIGFVIIFFI